MHDLTESLLHSAPPGIVHIHGPSNVLVMAPHGVLGDDDHTDLIAEALAARFGFHALINRKYRRPRRGEAPDPARLRVDANRIDQVRAYLSDDWLTPVLEIRDRILGQWPVMWVIAVHGVKDASVDAYARVCGGTRDTHFLLGYGQGLPEADRSAPSSTIDNFVRNLSLRDFTARITGPGYKNYAANHPNNFTRFFRIAQTYDPKVNCVQVEIRWTGARDSAYNRSRAVETLGTAICRMETVCTSGAAW